MPPTVLAIHSHPDDIEFAMSGTLFLLADAGCRIHYMNIANGSQGTAEHSREEIIRIRRDESVAAAEVLGAEFHESICDDMGVFYIGDYIRQVCAVVRRAAPDIILAASPQDYMEDHMNACRLALGGAFVRGMPNYRSIPPVDPIDRDVTIYHAMPHGLCDGLRNPIRPDFYVDVSPVIERKAEMLARHASQKDWLDRTQGFDSYIEAMTDMTARMGQLSGRFAFAEGWRRHLHFGYSRTERTPLEDLLTAKICEPA